RPVSDHTKEHNMTARKPQQLRPYEESAYHFCDVIDELAAGSGEHIAQKEVSRAIAVLAARHPEATDIALGAPRRTLHQIAYKTGAQIEKAVTKVTTKTAAPVAQAASKERTPHASPGLALYEQAVQDAGHEVVDHALMTVLERARAAKKSDPIAAAFQGP